MWGKNKTVSGSAGATTLIAPGTSIIGDVEFIGDLEVQGRVRGNICARTDNSTGGDICVRVVEGGRVEGDIRAPLVIVNGEVEGDIHAAEHVELAAKAQIQGNIYYRLIEMAKGAQLSGNLISAEAVEAAVNASVNTEPNTERAPGEAPAGDPGEDSGAKVD